MEAIPCHSAQFLPYIFSQVLETLQGPLIDILDLKKERALSFLCDETGIQDSACFRVQRRSLLIARALIDEAGDLKKDTLSFLRSLLEKEGQIFYPNAPSDTVAMKHILNILTQLEQDPQFFRLIKQFRQPLCHEWAEELVRDTLGIFEVRSLKDAEIRIAVLSAVFSVLRQSVGSCFATAPAILIQKEQPKVFLADLYELLTTGKLKRTLAGIEYCVPLSPSTGSGDLYRNISLDKVSFFLKRSPGLLAALEAAEMMPSHASLAKEGFIRVDELIHFLCLTHFSLKEEDLVLYKKMQKSWVKGQGNVFQGSLSGYLSPKKAQACEALQKKEKKAKAAFKALTDHPLLKAWEYTLASFSESKMEFSRWNLYLSLGLHHEEEGGIGQIIYKTLHHKLEESNQKVVEYQAEYAAAFEQVRAVESLLSRASTESEARRLKAEHTSRLYHMQSCLDIRDKAQEESSLYSSFFSFLLKEYHAKFQEYFQEIYDADMQGVQVEQYEDSPAGFRLVYKHGRSNASLWTMIYDEQEYIEALADFFLSVESQISASSTWDRAPFLLSDLTSKIVAHIRTDLFLETSLFRMAKAHGGALPNKPLNALEKMEKKPWAYTSGGTMDVLLATYYKRENPFTIEARWAESETDLLTFILDTLKQAPLTVEESLLKEEKGMLITSPSHAFILYPYLPNFLAGWQEKMFTYTWIRDEVILKGKQFYENQLLSLSEQIFLVEEFAKRLPPILVHKLKVISFLDQSSSQVFRNYLVEFLHPYPVQDLIDSFLYEMLPIIPGFKWKQLIHKILKELNNEKLEPLLRNFPDEPALFMTAKTVRDLITSFALLALNNVSFSFDLQEKLILLLEKEGLLRPAPIIFADTNWTHNYFAFLVNPGTLQLELWRVDKMGIKGAPMSSWKHWLNGQNQASWSIYSRPFEYL